jgi:hypothetical protein
MGASPFDALFRLNTLEWRLCKFPERKIHY